jgi:hypothetical protein
MNRFLKAQEEIIRINNELIQKLDPNFDLNNTEIRDSIPNPIPKELDIRPESASDSLNYYSSSPTPKPKAKEEPTSDTDTSSGPSARLKDFAEAVEEAKKENKPLPVFSLQ